MAVTPAATFCATLVEEWVGAGLTTAMVAPGSRSTPLALALADHPAISVHVFHDERTAGFAALGCGLMSGRPAIVLCSSGTAGTHFHAAVVEADLSGVPMLVVTADRPPELRDVGAAQTIDQTHLFGRAVRWYHDPGPPADEAARSWRSLGRRAYRATLDGRPGPVHLNLPFREPLVGEPGSLPAGRPPAPTSPATTASPIDGDLAVIAELLDRHRGVIVAGRGAGDPAAVAAFATAVQWPILAEPRSGLRSSPLAVLTADDLLRHPRFARDHTPEVVLHLGEPWASRIVNEWLAGAGARHVHVSAGVRPLDPNLVVDHWLAGPVDVILAGLGARLAGALGTPWLARWQHAEARARAALATVLDEPAALSEPGVARAFVATLDAIPGARLVVSSSMPIRDVEWYTGPGGLEVLSNRGANGIDGVVATAIGAALGTDSAGPTGVLVGDVAFLHDASSLTGLARRGLDLRIVVTDNDGGGIFSFLPQATSVPSERFEQLYGTPHGTDLVALAHAHGLVAAEASTFAELREAIGRSGPSVTVVRSDRRANVAVHDAIHRAVQAALG
jgi:2-succinyl-5-enolpyruvyl-6-hydroxy-3-cyclohexene-1-carboxylate synthase